MPFMTEAEGRAAMLKAISDHVEGSGQGGAMTNNATKAGILLALISGEKTGEAISELIAEVISTEGWVKL